VGLAVAVVAACAAGLGLHWLVAQLPMLPAPLDAWLLVSGNVEVRR
jgi:hypothetical protein